MSLALPQIARIRPAQWFAHADGLDALESLVDARARAMECAHDGRAGFARGYGVYLDATRVAMEAGTYGLAEEWIARLTTEHAHGWLRAMDGYDRGQMSLVPGPWRAVFAQQRNGLPARDALRISLAAHLLYDLPLAIARTDPHGLSGEATRRAFDAQTRVLVRALGDVSTAALRARPRPWPLTALSPAPLRPRDTTMWRRQAWRDGDALLGARTDAARSVVFECIRVAALRSVAPA